MRDYELSQARSGMYCHPECSEGALSMGTQMLRSAQHDKSDLARESSKSRAYDGLSASLPTTSSFEEIREG